LQAALDGPAKTTEAQEPQLMRVLAVLAEAGAEHRSALRHQLRVLLHYHSGVRTFQTRQLLLDLPRLQVSARPH